MKEYIENSFQEYDSADATTREKLISELNSDKTKLEYFIARLERLQKEHDMNYIEEDPWEDYARTELTAITK